jgi:Holliday junction resolvase
MPKSHKPDREYENQLAQIFRDSGWEVIPRPHAPSQADLIIRKDDLDYAVELKRAPESRRDRVVPLLAEAILHAQAYARKIPSARPLAIIASPYLSLAVVHSSFNRPMPAMLPLDSLMIVDSESSGLPVSNR